MKHLPETIAISVGLLVTPAAIKSTLAKDINVTQTTRTVELVLPDVSNPGKTTTKRRGIFTVQFGTGTPIKGTLDLYNPATERREPAGEVRADPKLSGRAVIYRPDLKKPIEISKEEDRKTALAFQSTSGVLKLIYPNAVKIEGVDALKMERVIIPEESLQLPSSSTTVAQPRIEPTIVVDDGRSRHITPSTTPSIIR